MIPPERLSITIEIDVDNLTKVTDQTLALYWHVAQANPADDFSAVEPGRLAERIGREIIRRWLLKAQPELHTKQGEHFWWWLATTFAKHTGDGNWVARTPEEVAERTARRDARRARAAGDARPADGPPEVAAAAGASAEDSTEGSGER